MLTQAAISGLDSTAVIEWDKREEQQRQARILSKQLLQSQTTHLRLEQFSLGVIRTILLVIFLLDACSIALGVLITTFCLVTSSDRLDGIYQVAVNKEVRSFVLFAEAISRTLALLLLLTSLFIFTYRVIRYYYRVYQQKKNSLNSNNHMLDGEESDPQVVTKVNTPESPLPNKHIHDAGKMLAQAAIRFVEKVGNIADAQNEQVTNEDTTFLHFRIQVWLIIWMVIVAMNPACSIYGIVMFWKELAEHINQFFGQLEVVYDTKARTNGSDYAASVVLTSIFTSMFHLFLHSMIHFLDRKPIDGAYAKNKNNSGNDEAERERKETSELEWYDSEAELPNAEARAKTCKSFSWISINNARHCIRIASRTFHQWNKNLREQFFYDLEWKFLLPLFLYLGMQIGFAFRLDFHPSFIPVVSLITVGRVCSLNSSLPVLQNNQTLVTVQNRTFQVSYSSEISPHYGPCSYLQPDNQPFYICIVVGALVFLDLYFFFLVWKKSKRTIANLALLPYDSTRSNQLGFAYFRMVAWISCIALFIASIVSCFVEPISSYLVTDVSINNDPNNATVTLVSFVIRPFPEVGIGPLIYGFGCIYLIIVVQFAQLAFGFDPKQGLKDESSMQLAKEADVAVLSRLMKMKKNRPQPAIQSPKTRDERRRSSAKGSFKSMLRLQTKKQTSELQDGPQTPLEFQLASNVLVLETAVLLYHFMSLSYDICENKEVQAGNENAMQAMVEDDRYTACLYAKDAITDTHAFVFYSDDRIVVAFRGSVSLTNYKTDWDSSEVESEHGPKVEPLLNDEVNLTYSRKIASRKAYVHGGFVKAYDSVKQRIYEKVDELYNEPGTRRSVLVTGHSLGGGLAVVCGFDLGVRLNIPPYRIGLMTWGCPKVGTFSFVKRVNRIIPCVHRIATANDVITQLPFESPLNDWTLRGWHHVGTEILLMANGNMIVRPSAVERFMIHKMKTSVSAHFRLSYAVALAAWIIRSFPDMHPNWWMSIIQHFTMSADFSSIPPAIREQLLWDLRRPGAAYYNGPILVRDQAVDTSTAITTSITHFEDSRDVIVARVQARQAFIQSLVASQEDEERFARTVRDYLEQLNIPEEDENANEQADGDKSVQPPAGESLVDMNVPSAAILVAVNEGTDTASLTAKNNAEESSSIINQSKLSADVVEPPKQLRSKRKFSSRSKSEPNDDELDDDSAFHSAIELV